ATLVVPMKPLPSDMDLVFAYVSSIVNPVADDGVETTNWVVADVRGRDEGAETMSFALHDFTFVYVAITVDPEHRTYLVTDIPARYLRAGDLLYTLTQIDSDGPDWQPGHVAGFVGKLGLSAPSVPTERIVEANGSHVVSSTLSALKSAPGHIYLGPR